MQQLTVHKIKIHHHFVSENKNFAQNPFIPPTQFKLLNTSCCLCYRRQNFCSFTVSLSCKMKCMTDFLSLFSLWQINESRFTVKLSEAYPSRLH